MDASEKEWKRWNWRSDGDKMLNGAFFVSSGSKSSSSYSKATSLKAKSSSVVPAITASAGALSCKKGSAC
jgi:pectate lyase